MSRASEESLAELAQSCESCIDWLEHCRAECCKHFSFRLTPKSDVEILDDVIRIRIWMTDEARFYYELHGATLEDDVIVVPRERCEVSRERIIVSMRCDALQADLRCELHPDRKPETCKGLTRDTAHNGEYRITPKCMFAYRLRA